MPLKFNNIFTFEIIMPRPEINDPDKKCTKDQCYKGQVYKQYPPDHPEFRSGGCPKLDPPPGKEKYVSDYDGKTRKWK